MMKLSISEDEIHWVEFNPSVGHEFKGRRPALVIQSNEQLKKSNLITVIPLTGNLQNKTVDDILIKADTKNRLASDSIAKVYNIISFDSSRFIKRVGIIDRDISGQVKIYLKKHFDITNIK